jgi:hypothetical protein
VVSGIKQVTCSVSTWYGIERGVGVGSHGGGIYNDHCRCRNMCIRHGSLSYLKDSAKKERKLKKKKKIWGGLDYLFLNLLWLFIKIGSNGVCVLSGYELTSSRLPAHHFCSKSHALGLTELGSVRNMYIRLRPADFRQVLAFLFVCPFSDLPKGIHVVALRAIFRILRLTKAFLLVR